MKKVVIGIVVLLLSGIVVVCCIKGTTSEKPEMTIETATTSEECVEVSGNWVDTSNNESCTAANGLWEEDACSISSYCEALAEESEDTETPAEDTEPTEGQ